MTDSREFFKQLLAKHIEANRREYRKLARETGLVECYVGSWHGRGVFEKRIKIRVARYSEFSEVVGEILGRCEEDLEWRPVKIRQKELTEDEWQQVVTWVSTADFWNLPSRDDACPCMDGDAWEIEGFRKGKYHLVKRHTGSVVEGTGAEVYRLGQCLLDFVESVPG